MAEARNIWSPRPLRLYRQFLGKLRAARTLAQFIVSFRNWREVWSAYRKRVPLPPFALRNGLSLHHGPADDPILLIREIYLDRVYTRGGFYRPKLTDTVLDLGANIGFYALWLQGQALGIRVHSFEPASENRERLVQNVRVNGLEEYISVYPFAVSDGLKLVNLHRAESSGHRSLFDRATTLEGIEEVEAVDLAFAVKQTGAALIDMLKIDVEGSEIEIVEGAGAEVWQKIKRVVVEYHDLFRPGCRQRVEEVLKREGFARIETIPELGVSGLGLIRASRF